MSFEVQRGLLSSAASSPPLPVISPAFAASRTYPVGVAPLSLTYSLCDTGRTGEAGRCFEAAAEKAHRIGLYLHEALALRDLKVCDVAHFN